jgi:TRAP-type C4-dicarboxylate transport system permease small subunit
MTRGTGAGYSMMAGAVVEQVALAGGIALILAAAMVTTSVTLRSDLVGGRGVPGDFELVQMATAACAFAFLPLCQHRRGHIFVDTFTGWVPAGAKRVLDAVWDIFGGVVAALLAWRLAAGAIGEFRSGTTTMVLGVPTGYAIGLCAGLAVLLAVVSVLSAITRISGRD